MDYELVTESNIPIMTKEKIGTSVLVAYGLKLFRKSPKIITSPLISRAAIDVDPMISLNIPKYGKAGTEITKKSC